MVSERDFWGEKRREGGMAYPELKVRAAHVLHGGLGPLGVLAEEHLDKGMALVLVDDAGLDLAETVEDFAELVFGAAGRGQSTVLIRGAAACARAVSVLTLHRPQKGSGCTP
jgi:hypothetical protein